MPIQAPRLPHVRLPPRPGTLDHLCAQSLPHAFVQLPGVAIPLNVAAACARAPREGCLVGQIFALGITRVTANSYCDSPPGGIVKLIKCKVHVQAAGSAVGPSAPPLLSPDATAVRRGVGICRGGARPKTRGLLLSRVKII